MEHLRITGRTAGNLAMALVLVAVLGAFMSTHALAEDGNTEAKITAAFVFNFCKFVDWPEEPDSILTVWICGDPANVANFDIIKGKTINRATLEVVASESAPTDRPYQVAYIPADQSEMVPALLASLAELPILTISDSKGFCERGGMIELARVQGKMKFSVNSSSAKQADLAISSRLLKMARQVIK